MLEQNGRCIADDIFKSTYFKQNVSITIEISVRLIPSYG